MKINLIKSKLLPSAKKMPPLSHNYLEGGGRDSGVLRWLAQQEDLQMWLFCILRCSGLVVRDSETGKYYGDQNWAGVHRKHLNPYKGGRRVGKKWIGGRPAVHCLKSLMDEITEAGGVIMPGELRRVMKSKHGMATATYYRYLQRLKSNFLIQETECGYRLSITPPTSSTSDSPPTTTNNHCPSPLS